MGITSDTLWLAEFSPATDGMTVCELGCGNGEISLSLAARARLTITGIDLAPGAIKAAETNRAKSAIMPGSSVRFLQMTIMEAPQKLGRSSFDMVVCNPPFHRRGAGRSSPDPDRRMAREETTVTLAQIMAAAAALLKPRGWFCAILPPERLLEATSLGVAHGLPLTHIQPVHPDPDKPARRVLVRACRGARASLVILPARLGGT